ncbi:hypothetical protein H4219_006311 [Mycoemilia scoparia]|uniref:Endonuclease/exonuclease/phosphatase domain-containing protein n=1 Tax=Mycoemilia scoparia TaxID=417184 RepID=A0A9W8DMB4_9FUNG|nr:hypothetical protein H4219_006311 [Mycoemilia scoparia]
MENHYLHPNTLTRSALLRQPVSPLGILSHNILGARLDVHYNRKQWTELISLISTPSSLTHILFLQEFKSHIPPQDALSLHFRDYNITSFKPKPNGKFDIITITHSTLGLPVTLPESTDRVGLTLLPDVGLLLINIHAPNSPPNYFFTNIISLVSCYKANGYEIVLGGDMNTTIHPTDHSSLPSELHGSTGLISLLQYLEVTDIADYLNPSSATPEGHPIPRKHLFTHRTNLASTTPNACIDIIAIPDSFIGQFSLHIELHMVPTSDHSIIHAFLNPRPQQTFVKQPKQNRIPPSIFSYSKANNILDNLIPDHSPAKLAKDWHVVKASLLAPLKALVLHKAAATRTKIIKLCKRICSLSTCPGGRSSNATEILQLEDQVVALTAEAGAHIRQTRIKNFCLKGDSLNRWSAQINKNLIQPHKVQEIKELTDPTTGATESSPDGLCNAALNFYKNLYASAPSLSTACNSLFNDLKSFLQTSSGFTPGTVFDSLFSPFSNEEFKSAAKTAGKNKLPGPDGIPSDVL